ncbi:DUF2381 family protein [Comamonas sp. JC664]|uniref:DUF2381 family protein n=1 Tax=Comamonas sp. JC664 TaxID=2801917 RepID=UPI001748A6C0|nr:DUF2381 family protein [Comamonas sp. JC664]MBL0693241.1 DUF2381 family protein [Comamonas sp. JC664]GHG97569.1 hypothetical protein GCM10012319_62630 [Comamonas sp. KCTC 72670]
MTGSPAFIVLAWGVLWSATAQAAAQEPPGSGSAVRRIDVQAGTPLAPQEVRISPGLSTTVFFDARIRPEQLVLEGRERFQRFGVTEDHLVLVPSSTFREGERLRLEVRFHDGAVPERAVMVLVVDSARAERQVELFRQTRSAASYQQEVEELRSGMLRLERQVQQLQRSRPGECSRESLVADLGDEDSIAFRAWFPRKVSGEFSLLRATFLRLSPRWAALRLTLTGTRASRGWAVAGAELTDAQGRRLKSLPPWQAGPVGDGETSIVILLDEPSTPGEGLGRYTLELWNEGRKQTLKMEGLQAR